MAAPKDVAQRYLTVPLAAAYLGLTETALRHRVRRGLAPPVIHDGVRRVVFDRLALDRWMKERRVTREDLRDDGEREKPVLPADVLFERGARSGRPPEGHPPHASQPEPTRPTDVSEEAPPDPPARGPSAIDAPELFENQTARTFMMSDFTFELLTEEARRIGCSRSGALELCVRWKCVRRRVPDAK